MLDQAERLIFWCIVLVNIVFPVVLFWTGWPKPWRAFRGEASAINWFSSVQCALLGAQALAIYCVTRYGRSAGADPIHRSWPWLLLALGFFFLSFDERFEFHENARELFLKPRDVLTGIPWLKPADIVLPLYAVAGTVLTVFLFKDLQRFRLSLYLFVGALALIVVTVVQDSLMLAFLEDDTIRHAQIIAEETAKIWAQALFGLSLVSFLFYKLRSLENF